MFEIIQIFSLFLLLYLIVKIYIEKNNLKREIARYCFIIINYFIFNFNQQLVLIN